MINTTNKNYAIIALLAMLFIFPLTNNVDAIINLANITEVKLTASDAAEGDWFGWPVDIDGDTLVVGAASNDSSGDNSGSVYVFRNNGTTWVEEAKLTASDAAEGDFFGYDLDIDGDTLVVGAAYDWSGNKSGAAYVFRYNGVTWVEEAKLTASDATKGDWFGYGVAIDGNTVLVGAAGLYDDTPGPNKGKAYIFKFDETIWVEEVKLTASDAAEGDQFGWPVALEGNTIVIGARGDDDAGRRDSGSVYVFRNNGTSWVEEAKLTASDPDEEDYFSDGGLAISGDTVVVGAWANDDAGRDSGSVYVFRNNGTTWVEEAKLTASDAAEGDWFGWPVDIDSDTLVVGAPGDDDAGSTSGSVYVFRNNGTTWVEEAKLTASDADEEDYFSDGGLAISGDTVVVGAWANDDAGGESGSAYIFNLPKYLELIIDIKPGSDPNCFNFNGHGVIPIAILGSADFDVNEINIDTLLFNGSSVQVRGKNEKTMCHYEDVSRNFTYPEGSPEGHLDLVCQFEDDPNQWVPGQAEATLTGELIDGTLIEGTDSICIVP